MPRKGETNNPNGRPEGSKNKKTIEWEAFGKAIIEHGSDRAKQIMDKSNDKDFMFYYLNLLEYFKPKQSRQEMTGEIKQTIVKVVRD